MTTPASLPIAHTQSTSRKESSTPDTHDARSHRPTRRIPVARARPPAPAPPPPNWLSRTAPIPLQTESAQRQLPRASRSLNGDPLTNDCSHHIISAEGNHAEGLQGRSRIEGRNVGARFSAPPPRFFSGGMKTQPSLAGNSRR